MKNFEKITKSNIPDFISISRPVKKRIRIQSNNINYALNFHKEQQKQLIIDKLKEIRDFEIKIRDREQDITKKT